jgi:hypothetical protein
MALRNLLTIRHCEGTSVGPPSEAKTLRETDIIVEIVCSAFRNRSSWMRYRKYE